MSQPVEQLSEKDIAQLLLHDAALTEAAVRTTIQHVGRVLSFGGFVDLEQADIDQMIAEVMAKLAEQAASPTDQGIVVK